MIRSFNFWRRHRLDALKAETRARDLAIIRLARKVDEAQGEAHASNERLDHAILAAGDQFAAVTRQLTQRLFG